MTVPPKPVQLTLFAPPRHAPAADRFEIALAGVEVPVRLRRNAAARRYILRVDAKTREVILTLPSRGTRAEARAFLDKSRGWLEKRLADMPPHRPIVDGGVIPVRGEPCRIVHRGGRGTAMLVPGEPMPTLVIAGMREYLPRRVVDWLKREARRDLEVAVATHADRLGLRPRSVTLRDPVSRWGSCSSSGALSFSWRLVMAPPFVLDYLAAHEVAHLSVMDHSRRYWRLLATTCDHIKPAERWLRLNGQSLHAIGPEARRDDAAAPADAAATRL